MRLIPLVLALSLAGSAAFAAETGPLSPGNPAGVKKAQISSDTAIVILAGVGVVVGVAVAASGGGGGSPASGAQSTTTSTSTTG